MCYPVCMTIALPRDLEAWAKSEVSAGRAESVESLVAQALEERRSLAARHKVLVDEAYASVAKGAVVGEVDADVELDRWIAEDLAKA